MGTAATRIQLVGVCVDMFFSCGFVGGDLTRMNVLKIGVCLRSSTSPAWPVPTERTVAGGPGRRCRLYIWYCIINTKNGDSRSI